MREEIARIRVRFEVDVTELHERDVGLGRQPPTDPFCEFVDLAPWVFVLADSGMGEEGVRRSGLSAQLHEMDGIDFLFSRNLAKAIQHVGANGMMAEVNSSSRHRAEVQSEIRARR